MRTTLSEDQLRVHVLQHVPFEDIGAMAPWLHSHAAEVSYTRFFEEPCFRLRAVRNRSSVIRSAISAQRCPQMSQSGTVTFRCTFTRSSPTNFGEQPKKRAGPNRPAHQRLFTVLLLLPAAAGHVRAWSNFVVRACPRTRASASSRPDTRLGPTRRGQARLSFL